MDPDQAQAEIRNAQTHVAYLNTQIEILQTYIDEWEDRFTMMQASRNRWRTCAMRLGDQVITIISEINTELLDELLDDPIDGAGLGHE